MRPLAMLVLVLGTLATASRGIAATGDPVLEAPAMRWPAPVTRTLDNGLQVAVFARRTLPVVQVQLTLPAGSAAEGTLPEGTAALLAALVRTGTSSRTAADFQRDLERIGGSMGASVTRDHAIVQAAFLADQIGAGLELLSDAVIHPILAADELESARRIALAAQAPQRGTATGLADEHAWRAAFAPHPYQRPTFGSARGLIAVTRDDLRAMLRDHWRPDRSSLVIAGDIDPARAFALAEDWFGRWSGTAVSDHDWPLPRPGFGRVHLVDAPGDLAEIRLVRPAPARGSRELLEWTIAATALQTPGRLPEGVRASITPQREASLLVITGQAPADSAAARVRAIQAAFAQLAAHPPAAAELTRARDAYAASLPQSIETLGGLAAQWAVGRQAGLGDDHLAQRATTLAAAAPPAPALWGLWDKPWVMVVAGPADRLERALAAIAPVTVVRTHDEADSPVAPPPPTLAESARGRQLVEAAISAHGGLAKLQAVRSLATEGELELVAPVGNVLAQFSAVRLRPDRFFMATKVFETSMQQVLVGDRGWTATPSGDTLVVRDLDSTGVALARSLMENDAIALLLAARDGTLAARGEARVDAARVDAVEYTTATGVMQRLLFDPATHRLLGVDFARSPAGEWEERRQFGDYRQLGGVWIPFVEERFVSGEKLGTTTTRRAQLNRPVDPKLFAYPGR